MASLAGRWDTQAEEINAAMDRVLCTPGTACPEPDPDDPTDTPSVTDADVTTVRQALTEIGHPEAEVRPVQPGDNGPWDTVMYGVPLGHGACAVSYVTIGQHPGRLGAVGALTTGRCLRPPKPTPPN